ncbi:hypothetical protein K438DRAFT_300937 [Mycena galopus ATCC 62051]|nr:hypothetical protein K438DRAFT_300937 [Mycena galopus ATCC 62051]
MCLCARLRGAAHKLLPRSQGPHPCMRRCVQAVASLNTTVCEVCVQVRASCRLTRHCRGLVRACAVRKGPAPWLRAVRACCCLARHCRSRVRVCATACKPIASPTITEVVSVRAPVCEVRARVRASCCLTRHYRGLVRACTVCEAPAPRLRAVRAGYCLAHHCRSRVQVACVHAPVREAPPPRLRGGARKVSPRSPLQGSPCMREARTTQLRVLRASRCVVTIAGGKADAARAYGTLRASFLQPLPCRRLPHQ